MQAIKAIRAAGFTVQPATEAIGCTEVVSDKLFYFYNPRFVQAPADVFDKLEPANLVNGRYCLLIAGKCPPDEGQIPLAVVSAELWEAAGALQLEYEDKRRAAREAEQNFYGVVRQMMAQ